jgi:hypothetical protein
MAETVRRTEDKFDLWAKNWATGMRIAAPYTDRRRIEQSDKAKSNRAAGASRPCGIAGCKRHSFKGQMCRKHYAMVPWQSKMALVMACYDAQFKVAARHRAKMLRELRAALKAEAP